MTIKLFKGSEYGLDSPLAFNAKDNFKINPCEKGPPTSAESRLLASVFEIGQGNPFHSKLHGPTTLYLTEGELHLEDIARPGERTILTSGDVVLLEVGTVIRLSSPSSAKGIGISYAPGSVTAMDYFVEVKRSDGKN